MWKLFRLMKEYKSIEVRNIWQSRFEYQIPKILALVEHKYSEWMMSVTPERPPRGPRIGRRGRRHKLNSSESLVGLARNNRASSSLEQRRSEIEEGDDPFAPRSFLCELLIGTIRKVFIEFGFLSEIPISRSDRVPIIGSSSAGQKVA
jgi:hypothetical protein